MSALTEEQRRRIEENRLKALEKRAKAAAATSSSSSVHLNGSLQSSKSTPSVSTSLQYHKPITNSTASSFNKYPANSFANKNCTNGSSSVSTIQKFSGNSFASHKTSTATSTTFQKSGYNVTNNKNLSAEAAKAFANEMAKSSQTRDYLRGTCVLHSRNRFFVDVGYNKELIDLFKTVPSRLYDMQTKKWNFSMEDYDKLLSIVKPLQPDIIIIPLPPLIKNVFSSAPSVRRMKEHDLSVLDPFLLQSLLPFQKDGVNYGIHHEGRVLIADDMGLGKTVQAIAIANFYSKDWPLLVVTPSSVRYTWQEAFHRWLPSLDPGEITVINSGKDHIPNNKVILTSYDLLSKIKDSLQKRNFKSMILDESHFIKSHKAARCKAAQEIAKNMKRIILLSGTPALSKPIELFTQLSMLRPRKFFAFKEYGLRYCNGSQTQWGWDFNGASHMGELQLYLEEEIMIRRLKSDVIKQLPDKFRQMIVLDPSQVQTKSKILLNMSAKMKEESLKGMERRGILLEYFHETGQVKLKAVCEYVLDLLESNKKFLCFAHHQNVLNGLCKAIEGKNVKYIRIDGRVSSEQRKKLCDEFQFDDKCQVAVLSITAANCGITLTAASLVVFAELFWNPGILTQAEDRAHRIGQENSVVVQYLVAKGTADDEIWPLVQKKLDVLNKAGLSKDNFKSADTIVRDDKTQTHLDDFWSELDDSLNDSYESSAVPEKRLKLEL